jgi:hypothetical protein
LALIQPHQIRRAEDVTLHRFFHVRFRRPGCKPRVATSSADNMK